MTDPTQGFAPPANPPSSPPSNQVPGQSPAGLPAAGGSVPAPTGSASSSFFDTLRSEYIKATTLRSFWVVVGLSVAFPVVITILTAGFASDPFTDYGVADTFAALCVLSAMVVAAFCVATLTGEYSHNTVRVTYAATPNRLRVQLAKLVLSAILGVLVQFVAYLACWVIAKATNSSLSSITSHPFRTSWLLMMLLGALLTLFGLGLGLILRSTAGAVTLLLVWPLVIEPLLAGLLFVVGARGIMEWLPYTLLLDSTASVTQSGGSATDFPVPQLWFFAVAAAIWVIGFVRETGRDA